MIFIIYLSASNQYDNLSFFEQIHKVFSMDSTWFFGFFLLVVNLLI